MPKEIPILFSGIMVAALLENRKGVTRRLTGLEKINENPGRWTLNPKKWKNVDGHVAAAFTDYDADETIMVRCPYGDVGDLLWVREKFAHGQKGILDNPEELYVTFFNGDQIYSKGGYAKTPVMPTDKSRSGIKWKPSIHMPKWASRIWLQNTSIIVDQLHDITEEEAIKEGVEFDWSEGKQYKNYQNDQFEFADPRDSFKSLWIKIHGLDSWNKNPYVWAPSFSILSTTGWPDSIPNFERSVATEAKSEK